MSNQTLNASKNIFQFNYTKDFDKILEQALKANIIIIGDSRSSNELLKLLLPQLRKCAIIKLSGGKDEWKNLHDLNALALTKTFHLHLENELSPPYLPFAGISFGQYIATFSLALLRSVENKRTSQVESVYLKDVTEFIFAWKQQSLIV